MPDDIKRLRELLKTSLAPIFAFALVNSAICWACAWIFYDRYEFSATFLGFGCGGIVVALCSYLYVLTSELGKQARQASKEADVPLPRPKVVAKN